jgi:hypothetical protein
MSLWPSALTLQGSTYNTLPNSDWLDNESVLLSLADHFENSQNKLKFRWENVHSMTESR